MNTNQKEVHRVVFLFKGKYLFSQQIFISACYFTAPGMGNTYSQKKADVEPALQEYSLLGWADIRQVVANVLGLVRGRKWSSDLWDRETGCSLGQGLPNC